MSMESQTSSFVESVDSLAADSPLLQASLPSLPRTSYGIFESGPATISVRKPALTGNLLQKWVWANYTVSNGNAEVHKNWTYFLDKDPAGPAHPSTTFMKNGGSRASSPSRRGHKDPPARKSAEFESNSAALLARRAL